MASVVLKRAAFVLVLVFALAASWAAGPGAARTSQALFDRFFATATSFCRAAPAPDCVGRLWPIADGNGDGVLEIGEVEAVYLSAREWAGQAPQAGSGAAKERNVTLVSLMVLKYAGLGAVFANFDSDGNGVLSRTEAFADFRLDRRPFGKIVADRDAVDWRSFAGKFGRAGVLIRDLVPPPGKPRRPR